MEDDILSLGGCNAVLESMSSHMMTNPGLFRRESIERVLNSYCQGIIHNGLHGRFPKYLFPKYLLLVSFVFHLASSVCGANFSASCFRAKRIFWLIAFHPLNIFKLEKMHEIASTVTLKMRLHSRDRTYVSKVTSKSKNNCKFFIFHSFFCL